MRHTEPPLDGMPEPPPAWVRPESGLRLSALSLSQMLTAAVVHASDFELLPALVGVRLSVSEGLLSAHATDRYSLYRERQPVTQTCDDFEFLLRVEDVGSLRVLLKSVLRGLKDEERETEPVDVALEQTDDGPTLRVLGRDLDVRFTQQEDAGKFPDFDPMVDRLLEQLDRDRPGPFDVLLNPSLLARVAVAQNAGRKFSAFSFRSPTSTEPLRRSPVVVTTLDEDDDLVIVIPVLLTDEAL